ncbi:putative rRNA methylase SpoU family [Aequorivita sublithincola DSM 14238]|uniref:Putative tRNA (cytidine(34)-2'-O)-methyltransferase n=1 Tax=Aequorivita sublithincola (strain DSM 14238 / LMG 21431 / ACAM 643 / 9-3) TaxID=746697 RepID=I3YXR3_AEQSU|nr:tRNA (cytidine(34)-2'-O)-methyltransferase [Aequorivita sublithincola]AFL81781.1 putative rRNA methylase SpoU family [Aequorivita sublithincola DSM 14238]
MPFNIVLFQPEIHTNTGNIGRLSLASGAHLHLVKPFGFEITDTRLKRAGLDYWQHISLFIYESIEDFYAKNKGGNFVYFSSHGTQDYCAIDYKDNMFFIFGKESVGLPKNIIAENPDTVYNIPIFSPHIRSLNLANAVSIVVYEGIRSLKNA